MNRSDTGDVDRSDTGGMEDRSDIGGMEDRSDTGRRHYARAPLHIPIRILDDPARTEEPAQVPLLRCSTANLGAGGAFLRTDTPMSIGTRFDLELDVPDGEPPIRLEGEVVWARPASGPGDPQAGMGIYFFRGYREQISRLQRWLGQTMLTSLSDLLYRKLGRAGGTPEEDEKEIEQAPEGGSRPADPGGSRKK